MTMQDEDFGATPDVFAEVESDPDPGTGEDPLADPLADPPAGATEAELAGDNPSEVAPEEPFAEEPTPEPEAEPTLPGEEEALAAAAAAEPPPQAADPLADPEPEPEPTAEPEPVAESEPEPTAVEPAAEPEPTAAAEPEAPAPKKTAKKAAKKSSKKAAKKADGAGEKKAAADAGAKRKSERDYVVLYEVDGGAFAVGPTVTARTTAIALEKAFGQLSKELGVNEFKNMVPVPATNWKPEPVAGETEQRTRVSIGK